MKSLISACIIISMSQNLWAHNYRELMEDILSVPMLDAPCQNGKTYTSDSVCSFF